MRKNEFNSNAKSFKRGRPLKKTLDIEFKVSCDGIVYYTDDKGNDIRVCNFVLTCVNEEIEFNDVDEHKYRYYVYKAKIKSVEEKISIKIYESSLDQKRFDIGLSLNYIIFDRKTFPIYVAQVTNNYLKSKNKLISRANTIKVSEPNEIDVERALEFLRKFHDYFISDKETFELYFASGADNFNLKDFFGFVEVTSFDVFYAIRTKEILGVLYDNESDFRNNSYIKSLYRGLRGLGVFGDSEKSRGYNFKTYRDKNRNPNNMTSCRIVKISKSKIEHICRIRSNEVVKDINTSFKEFKEMIHKKLELMIEEENNFPFKLKVDIGFSLPKVNLKYIDLLDGKISNPFVFIECCDFKFDKNINFLNLVIFLVLEFNFEFSGLSGIWECYGSWLNYISDGEYSKQTENYDRDRRERFNWERKFPFIMFIYSELHNFMCKFDHFYDINKISTLVLYENNPNTLEPACWTTYDDGQVYYINGYVDVYKKYFKGVFSIEEDNDTGKIEFSGDTYYDWLNSVATSLDIKIDYSNIDKNHSDLIKKCNNRIKCNIIKAIFYIRQNYIYRGDMKGTLNDRISSISSNDIDTFGQYIISCNSITSLDDLFIGKILNVFKNNKFSDTKFRLFQELDKEIENILLRLPNIHLRFILMIYCCIIGIGNIGNVFDYFSDSDGNDEDFFEDLNFLNWSKVKEFIDRNHK